MMMIVIIKNKTHARRYLRQMIVTHTKKHENVNKHFVRQTRVPERKQNFNSQTSARGGEENNTCSSFDRSFLAADQSKDSIGTASPISQSFHPFASVQRLIIINCGRLRPKEDPLLLHRRVRVCLCVYVCVCFRFVSRVLFSLIPRLNIYTLLTC